MNLLVNRRNLDPSQLGKDHLWQLLDQATAGMWVMQAETGEVWWSQGLWNTFGFDPATETEPPDIFSLTHPDDRERHQSAVGESVATHADYQIEVRMKDRSGDYRWLNAHGLWIETEEMGITMLGFVHDITERIQARQARQRSEALFRAFFDQAPAGVFIKDHESRHLYGNAMAAEIAGTTLDRFVGTTPSDLFTREAADYLETVDQKVLREGKPVSWTGPVQTASGEKRFIWDVKFPVEDVTTGERCVGGFGVDVTELHETKQKLEVAQRLESLGLLASGIAHDFNNLLFSIAGKAELAMNAGQTERQEHLQAVLAATDHAATLCKQLLTLGGKAHSTSDAVDVKALLVDSMNLFELTLQNQCQLETDLADETGMVRADAGQLQQVLVNLILNACQASAKDSVITLACRRTPLSDYRDESDPRLHSWLPEDSETGMCIAVEDRGHGIEPALLARIFEPYFSQQKRGHGLGLATVIGIVKSCSGAIRVNSQPGKGTRFECCFPLLTDAPKASGTASSEQDQPHSIRTALVIDDDELVANLTLAMLTRAGVKTESYTDSTEAVDILRERHQEFDLVISDISMPGMAGGDVLQVVRELNKNLPLILSSGDTSKLMNVGADPKTWLLAKPWSAANLNSLLAEISEAARSARPRES
ncbi:MAG: PAS domain S-box protein [Pseudomonadota bacterium]